MGREDGTLRLLLRVYSLGLCPVKAEGWMGPCTCSCLTLQFLLWGCLKSLVGRGSQAGRAACQLHSSHLLSPLHTSFFMLTPPATLQVLYELLSAPPLSWASWFSCSGTKPPPSSTWECLARETPRGGSKICPFLGFLPEAPRINLSPAPRTSERLGGHPNEDL